jgi:hypothetical protein
LLSGGVLKGKDFSETARLTEKHPRRGPLESERTCLLSMGFALGSSVQIRPPQPKFLVFHSVLVLSMLLVVE